MEPQTPQKDEKLQVILTQETLRAIYSAKNNGFIPPDTKITFDGSLIYEGLLTKVSRITLEAQRYPSSSSSVIVKRYLPPEEQILTFSGSTTVPPIDAQEFRHLQKFNIIDPNQPKPYFCDPTNHLIVMESLDGSYHDLLSVHYQRFEKANQKDKRRICTKVRADLETILNRLARTFQTINHEFNKNENSYAVSEWDRRAVLLARHDRGCAAIVNLGLHLDLSKIMDSPSPRIRTFRRITPGTISRESGVFFNRFNTAKERDILFEYLLLREAVCHGDLLPGNILYRTDAGGKPTQFVSCDFGKLFKAPFDFDLITLLAIDPRLKLMLSLPERKEIYRAHFDQFRANSLSPTSSSNFSMDERFALGTVASLLRYMGAIYFYLDQKNPEAAVHAQGDLSLLEKIDPHLPFRPDRYFGIQYASLLEILNTEPAKNLLPNLAKGVSYYFTLEAQAELKQQLQQDTRTAYHKITQRLRRSFRWLTKLTGQTSTSFGVL